MPRLSEHVLSPDEGHDAPFFSILLVRISPSARAEPSRLPHLGTHGLPGGVPRFAERAERARESHDALDDADLGNQLRQVLRGLGVVADAAQP